MTCPQCKRPLAGGLFVCPDCAQAGENQLVIYHLSGIAPGLPKPKRIAWPMGKLTVIYHRHEYLAHRFTILQYQRMATSMPSLNEVTVTIKSDLDPRILEAIQHGTVV